MKNRGLQVVLIVLVGGLLAWFFLRDDTPRPRLEARVETAVPPTGAPKAAEPAPGKAPPKVTFQLPKMGAPKNGRAPPPPPKVNDKIRIPKDWLLRGAGAKNYELRSDLATVFTGNASAVLMAHDKDVSPNLSGSGIQAVRAAPYRGTRVELSAMLRGEEMRNGGSIWMYVTDPSRVIVAYQVAQMSPMADAGEWTRYRIVMDIPARGEVLAYGFSLQGRGKLWADDVHLRIVDNAVVAVTGPQAKPQQVGTVAQDVSSDGAIPDPTNLDFEDVQVTRERQPPPPPDEIKGSRF